jgi:hypothetical protein
METERRPANERLQSEKQTLPVDWTESEWFRVWLKLARHEDGGLVSRPSTAC